VSSCLETIRTFGCLQAVAIAVRLDSLSSKPDFRRLLTG
jgi:hypothetical protein